MPTHTPAHPRARAGLPGSILRARALWLVGVCSDDLQPGPWGEAFRLVVAHMAAPDLVVRPPGGVNLGL